MRNSFFLSFLLFSFLFGTTSSLAVFVQPSGQGKISGRVFLDDHPEVGLSNIEVVALDIECKDEWCIWPTMTDANGHYSIEGLPENDSFILFTSTNPEMVTEGYFDELYKNVTSFSGSDVPWSPEAGQLEDILLNKISSNNLADPNILVTIVSLHENHEATVDFGLSTHCYSISAGLNLFAYPGKPISAYNTAFKLIGNETISPSLNPEDNPAICRIISPTLPLQGGADGIDWEIAYWDTLNQSPAGTDFKIEMNRGYVLYSSVDVNDLIMPPIIISSSPIDLVQGINLVSMPDVYDKEWSTRKALSHLNTSPDTGEGEEKATCLSHFEAKQGKWKSVTWLWGKAVGDDSRIKRNQGYLIHMKEPKQWSRVEEDITRAPLVTILSPLDNFTCNQGVNLQFLGSAFDYEDGTLAGEVLVWVSSIDGQIGQGTSFTKNNLSVGLHTITLTTTDSHGNKGSDQITMTILASSWAKKIGNNGDEMANSIQQTSDGGYIVAGDNGDNGYVLKLDSNGNKIWSKSYGGTNLCLIYCIQQTSDGGFIMAGYYLGSGDSYSDFYVAKLDADGNLSPSWPKIFDGGYGRDDGLRSIKQTLDGGYIMTGYTTRQDYTTDIYVTKFDANGNIASPWPKVFDGGDHGDDGGHSIQPTSDGGYILAGYTTLPDDTTNIYVAKLNANGTMATSWPKKFDGGSQYFDEAYSIQQTSDGGYILAGYTTLEDYTTDIYVAKLNADGTMATSWPKKFDGGSQDSDEAYSIQQTSDGGYILAGYTTNSEFWNRDFFMVKLTGNGSVDWKKIMGETNFDDEAKSVQQTFEGGYIAAGYTTNSDNTFDFYVVKLDSSGN